MDTYDPAIAPNPAQWLALDEEARIALAARHHKAARIQLPNLRAHALFHAIVENQIALGLDPVVRAMARLTTQGLSRHDAIHAVSTALAQHFFELMGAKDGALPAESQARYAAALDGLSAKRWRRDYG